MSENARNSACSQIPYSFWNSVSVSGLVIIYMCIWYVVDFLAIVWSVLYDILVNLRVGTGVQANSQVVEADYWGTAQKSTCLRTAL